MRIACKITPELIKKGKRKYCSYCPAALAIKHAFADSLLNLSEIEVIDTEIQLKFTKPTFGPGLDEEFYKVIPTSKKLEKFIRDFDAKIKVEPMNFVLKLDLDNR